MEGAAGLGGLRQTAPNRDLLHVFQKTGAGVCVCVFVFVLHGYQGVCVCVFFMATC